MLRTTGRSNSRWPYRTQLPNQHLQLTAARSCRQSARPALCYPTDRPRRLAAARLQLKCRPSGSSLRNRAHVRRSVSYTGYIGPNAGHRAFKREIVNAKVLYFQIQRSQAELKASFEKEITDAKAKASGPFSVGMVTEVLSPTQMRLLNIPHNEAALVVQDYGSVQSQFYQLLYDDLQRILESYLLDIYAEVARKDPRIMKSGKTTITWEEALSATDLVGLLIQKQQITLSHSDRTGLAKQFDDVGLPIVPADGMGPEELAFLSKEFGVLWGVRNLLQHNHGIVNDIFLRTTPGTTFSLGDRIVVDVAMLGRAFAVVEGVADNLNRRAVAKFGLGP